MPVRLRDDLLDWTLAVVVAVGAVLQQRGGCDCRRDPLWLNLGLVVVTTLPIGLRRRQPFAVLMVTGGAAFAHVLLGYTNGFLTTFAVVVAMFSVANYAPWSLSLLGAGAAVVVLPASLVVDWHNQGRIVVGDVPYNYALFGAAWILGDNLRREREQAQRARRLRTEDEERSRRAASEERSRIARELHDVIAHTLSVIVLQAGAGRRLAPDRARDVLGSIETLGRDALGDMRRMVGILRTDGDELTERAPQPSLAALTELAERVRSAGLAVDVRTEGEPRPLPPGVDLSAFRIVQEALTNALRHAGAAQARVVVRYAEDGVEVEVSDDGRGPAAGDAAGAGSNGHGLVGMRERVGLFGGQLEVGAGEGGGFRVRARLPA
jgi:signal transduction histidine kinase